MKKVFLPFVVLTLILPLSCEFEPSGSYFTDVDQPFGEAPLLSLNFNDSIIALDAPTNLEYLLSFENQKVLLIEFFMDGRLIESTAYNSGILLIEPFGSTRHRLEMVAYATTESGSIADAIDAEAFVYEWAWTIIFDQESPASLDEPSIWEEEGSLKIGWENPQSPAFAYYIIYREINGESMPLDTIYDASSTSYTDRTIIGGEVTYLVEMERLGFPRVKGTPASYTISSTPLLKIEAENDSQIRASWDACNLASNLSEYRLYEKTDESLKLVRTVSNSQDTSVVIDQDAFSKKAYVLEYRSQGERALDLQCSTGFFFLPGAQSMPDFDYIYPGLTEPYRAYAAAFYYSSVSDQLIPTGFPDNPGLFIADPEGMNFIVGNTLFTRKGEEYEEQSILQRMPDRYLNNENLEAFLPANSQFFYLSQGSNKEFYKIADDIVWTNFSDSLTGTACLTPDGSLISNLEDELLSFYQVSFYQEAVHSIPQCSAGPIYVTMDECYIQIGNALQRWNIRDWTHLESSTPVTGKLLACDPVSNTILTYSQGTVYAYNSGDYSLLAQREISEFYRLEPGRFAYLDGRLFLRSTERGYAVMLRLLN